MRCPVCQSAETKVVDSRVMPEGDAIRRRRECEKCNYRFSTLEEIELLDLVVVKNDGRRESYSRSKIERGIVHSLVKRPYTEDKFRTLLHAIERDLQKKRQREITSRDVGAIVMKHLKKFDTVAFIRFASIYRAFNDVKTFEKEIAALKK